MSSEVRARGPGARAFAILLGLSSLVAPGARAQEVAEAPAAGVWVDVAVKRGGVPEPPGLDFAAAEPLARLPSAAEGAAERLEELQAWNREERVPARIGFSRPLPRPRAVEVTGRDLRSFGAALLAGGVLTVEEERVTWAATLEVEEAHGLRARLRADELPAGSSVWTRGGRGVVHGPYGPGLVTADGTLWLPPVEGSRVSVEITVPRSALESGEALRVRLEEVAELVDPRYLTGTRTTGENLLSTSAATSCEIDSRCVGIGTLSVIDDYRHAVARLLFDVSGFVGACTGTLINDTVAATDIAYLWTANHCISTQDRADSLVAYFDYFTDACDGTEPSVETLPQVAGSTLLATGSTSDFTLLQLPAFPAGYNYRMGWTTRDLVEGEILAMVSHPEARRQAFSTSSYTESPNFSCGTFAGLFYAEQVTGSTLGGSSGASLIVDENGGQIVGELLGACSASNTDWCDYSAFTEVDGAFQVSYPEVAEWLDPPEPTLTLTVVDPGAAEPSDPGAFRISRNTMTGTALQVTVALSGTATAGTDYRAIASPVTLPAGAASVDVPVVPIDDVHEEGDESVILEIVSAPGFMVEAPTSATVTLGDDEGDDCRSVVISNTVIDEGHPTACGTLHVGPNVTVPDGSTVLFGAGVSVTFYDGVAISDRMGVSTCGMDLCVPTAEVPSPNNCLLCVYNVCAENPYCCVLAWDASCVALVATECSDLGLSCS